tara:strand:+ start:5190 stop:6296 length:1107 start_codon:yes stop_codon:yes gene_type:complete
MGKIIKYTNDFDTSLLSEERKFFDASPYYKKVLYSDLFKDKRYDKSHAGGLSDNIFELYLKNIREPAILEKENRFNPSDKDFFANIHTIKEDIGGAWEYNDLKFSGAKLFWLIHDIIINGLSYKPQGFIKEMTKIIYVSHPGTYRHLACDIAGLHNFETIVFDENNFLPNINTLDFDTWVSETCSGWARKERKLEFKFRENKIEVHESSNFHDWNIFIYDLYLSKMFNYNLPNVYVNKEIAHAVIDELKTNNENIYKQLRITPIDKNDVPLIPFKNKFKGVSMYISTDKKLFPLWFGNTPYCIPFFLCHPSNALAYNEDKDIVIFNNSHMDNKKLIPQLVKESTGRYINNFGWTDKVSYIKTDLRETE